MATPCGLAPVAIVDTTALVAVLITERILLPKLVTYAKLSIDGVTVTVAVTGDVPALVAVNDAILPMLHYQQARYRL